MAGALRSGIATKADLQALEARLREIEARLDLRIAATKTYVLKWVLVGAVALQPIVLLGAALALARVLTR